MMVVKPSTRVEKWPKFWVHPSSEERIVVGEVVVLVVVVLVGEVEQFSRI